MARIGISHLGQHKVSPFLIQVTQAATPSVSPGGRRGHPALKLLLRPQRRSGAKLSLTQLCSWGQAARSLSHWQLQGSTGISAQPARIQCRCHWTSGRASCAKAANFSWGTAEIDAGAMGIQERWAGAQWEQGRAADTNPAAWGTGFIPHRQQFFSPVTDFIELAEGYTPNTAETYQKT